MKEQEVYNQALANAFWITQNIERFKNIDPYALARVSTGVAKVESNFNPTAKNKNSTARGLMQILICTQREIEAKYLKVKNFPEASIYCKSYPKAPVNTKKLDPLYTAYYGMLIGQVYLAYQYNRYKDWAKAIHAYNQGSYNKTAPKAAGKTYLAKVNKQLNEINFAQLEKVANTTKALITDGKYPEFL